MQDDQLFIFDKFQKSFLNEKIALNMSNNTIRNYSGVLNKFYEYYSQFEDSIAFYDIDRDFIVSYLASIKNMETNTRNLHLTVIKSFFKYISNNDEKGAVFKNRFNDFKVKNKKSEVKYLSERELFILEKYLESPVMPKSFIQYRNSFLLKLLVYTGIRVSESIEIKIEDFELIEEGVYKIKVLGKGNKERYVYIPKEKIDREYNYFIENVGEGIIANSSKGKNMLRTGVYSMVKNVFKKLGIKKSGVHLLRHTFGKRMVKKNVNLSTIKELMGHENIQTTMIYARSDEQSMIEAVL